MMEETPVTTFVALWGFAAGIIFGITAQRTNFCTMGALSDIVFMGSYSRMRAWVLAIAVAMAGSQLMHILGFVDLGAAIYLTSNLGWLGAIIGGLMFGFGMTLAGGCGNKTLVRVGTGSLRSLVVALIIAISAYATLRGILGIPRLEFEAASMIDLGRFGLENQGIVGVLAFISGLDTTLVRPVLTGIIVFSLLAWCFKSEEFRQSRRDLIAGLVIGLLIPMGWYITGNIGNDDFDPVPLFSFTFVSPTADGLQYLMTFTGSTINFGIASIAGVIVGAFFAATATGEFRVETFVDAAI